jgi:hypothetical protein
MMACRSLYKGEKIRNTRSVPDTPQIYRYHSMPKRSGHRLRSQVLNDAARR